MRYLLRSVEGVKTTASKNQQRTDEFKRIWKRIEAQNEITLCEQVIRSSYLSSKNTQPFWGGRRFYYIAIAIVTDITV